MAIAIDGSSPAAVSQTDGTTAALVTASFTAPGRSAGTVTVNNNASSGDRHARLKVLVLTGVDASTPLVTQAEGNDTAGALDSISYTTAAANSWTVAQVSDWDVASTTFTAAAATTIVDSQSVASSINTATLRNTNLVAAGSTMAIGLTSPTSGTWNYVYVEVNPGNDNLILVCWSGNSQTGSSVTQPTISTSIPGVTFTLSNARTNTDAGAIPGQAAIWYFAYTAAAASIPYATRPQPQTRDLVEGPWLQRDRRDANTVAGAAPSAIPGGLSVRTVPAQDQGETYWQQARRADPSLLSTALLEVPAPEAPQPAVTHQRTTWIRQAGPRVDQSSPAGGAAYDPTLAPGPRTLAAYVDRRQVLPQRVSPAPVDDVRTVGTGAVNAWWSDDPTVAFMAATLPRYADPSLLAQVVTAADPLLFPAVTARRTPATHAERRAVPAQRSGTVPAETTTLIGTGAVGAWWSIDDTAHFGPSQRRALADQSSAPVALPFDVTLDGDLVVARLVPATHVDRRQYPQQPARLADQSSAPTVTPFDPTLAGLDVALLAAVTHARRPAPLQPRPPVAAPDLVQLVGTGAVGAWWSLDDWAHFGPAQRARLADQSSQPVAAPFDPLLAAFVPALVRRTPATHADRRLVPAQRAGLPVLDDTVIVGAGSLVAWWGVDDTAHFGPAQRRALADATTPPVPADPTQAGYGWIAELVAATHASRRLVPQQPARLADQSSQPVIVAADPTQLAYLVQRVAQTWPVERRLVPQQRTYVDPRLLAQALLEDALLGGADDLARHRTWWSDRRLVPAQRAGVVPAPVLADPLLLLGELTKRAGTPATHAPRWVLRWWRQALLDVGSPPAPYGLGTVYGGPVPGGTVYGAVVPSGSVTGGRR